MDSNAHYGTDHSIYKNNQILFSWNEDIQMLKFGQIVDLDLIERSAPNKYVQAGSFLGGRGIITSMNHIARGTLLSEFR